MDENTTQVGRAIREAHNDEKQMSASQPLVFLLHVLYYTILTWLLKVRK